MVPALEDAHSWIALHVVGEFQNVAARKLRTARPLTVSTSFSILEGFRTFPARRTAAAAALKEMAAGLLSYWDALLPACAPEAGCTVMLSEDMQDGVTLFGLAIVNPFGPAGASAHAAELLDLP